MSLSSRHDFVSRWISFYLMNIAPPVLNGEGDIVRHICMHTHNPSCLEERDIAMYSYIYTYK